MRLFDPEAGLAGSFNGPLATRAEDDYDTYAPGKKLSQAELVAERLVPPGPLAPAVTSKNPEQNLKNIGNLVNPPPIDPFTLLNKALTKGAVYFGQGSVSPEGAQKGVNFLRDLALSTVTNAALPGAGVLPALLRTGAQGALAGGTAAMEGRPMSEIATATGLGMAGQGGGELAGGIVKQGMTQAAGKAATADYAARQKAAEDANKFALENYGTEAANVGARNKFGTAMQEAVGNLYSEKGAADLAQHIKRKVGEPFKDFTPDRAGLLDMVYGQGQSKLSDAYETAIKSMEEAAKGKTIKVSPEAAAAFKLNTMGGLSQQQVNNMLKGGVSPEAIRRMGGGGEPGYDAQQAIRAILGKQAKYPREYREVVNALDDAGIKNDQTAAYKAAQAWITYIDKVKGLEGEQYHPDRMLAGLTQLKTLNQIRGRGEGDIFRSPLNALRETPPEFAPEALPTKPIPVSVEAPSGVEESPFFKKMLQNNWVRYGMGGVPGAMAAHAMGLPASHYAPMVAIPSMAAAGLLPHTVYKAAPLSAEQQTIGELLPIILGSMGSAGARYYGQ